MDKERYIEVREICKFYDLDPSFVDSLYEVELIEIRTREEARYIAREQIGDLERLLRLHRDLNINVEGLEAVDHLLRKMERLQEEVRQLRKELEGMR